MELSWSYIDTMRRMTSNTAYRTVDIQGGNYYPTALRFTLTRNAPCEIPLYLANRAERILAEAEKDEYEIVVPLCIDGFSRMCSGADTILKYFSRYYIGSSRLGRVSTPKGEKYYGASGIVLDKNFNPLLLATVLYTGERESAFEGATPRCVYSGINVHISPEVFLNDTAIINKSLAKKGMQYLLSQANYDFGCDGRPAKVVIDDCSQFIQKVTKPNVNAFDAGEVTQLLKDNIGDVLEQFVLDNRVF